MENNIDEAIKYLRTAAELGNEKAKQKLGEHLCSKEGTFSDLLEKFYDEGYKDAKDDKLNKYALKNVKVGDVVKFGYYLQKANEISAKEPIRWRVLAVENSKALLISQYAIEINEEEVCSSWKETNIRKWLNTEFLNNAFNKGERDIIQLSKVNADVNPKYEAEQGDDTEDKIFLLSIKEAEEYFKSDEDRLCKPTKYVKAKKFSTLKSLVLEYRKKNEGQKKPKEPFCNYWWWLRTAGSRESLTSYVYADGSIIYYGLSYSNDGGCVRPALWISLES